MKNIRKVLMSFVLLFSMVVFVACSGGEKTTTFVKDVNGGSIEITYYHKDDKVTKQTTHSVIPYSAIGVGSKEQAEADPRIKQIVDSYKDIKGIEHKIVYEADKFVEDVKVDFENLDTEKAKNMPGLISTGDVSKGVSLKASAELLKSQDFTEKK